MTATVLFASRFGMPVWVISVWGILFGFAFSIPNELHQLFFIAMCISMMLYWWVSPPRGASVNISSPVSGRWLAYNSPTSKVPSHSGHGWAQIFAIDFVFDPLEKDNPEFGDGQYFRPPEDYPGFGMDILSTIDGEVVKVWNHVRDHRARNSVPARVFMILEGIRELFGPVAMLGNHIVLRHRSGWYVLLAHLQQGSISLQKGDMVRTGVKVARCGNSGNSSEPHLHIQVMDRSSVWTAIGLHFTIDGQELPANDEFLETLLT